MQKEDRAGMHKECAYTGKNTGVMLRGGNWSLPTDLSSNWGR